MKILGSDFDGTLDYNGIDDAKKQAISRWRAEGNVFAVVSGRSMWDLYSLHKVYSFECDYLIGHNGSLIARPDGTPVSSIECDGSLAIPLLTYLSELGGTFFYVGTNFPCEIYANEAQCDEKGKYTLDTLPEIPYFNQISVYPSDVETARKMAASVREKFGDKFNPLQNGTCVDIVRGDINKAKGLYNLMNMLGAKHEDVIAVGDNLNDKDMLEEFRSYAMESGADVIKKVADYVTPGITELIEKELSDNR